MTCSKRWREETLFVKVEWIDGHGFEVRQRAPAFETRPLDIEPGCCCWCGKRPTTALESYGAIELPGVITCSDDCFEQLTNTWLATCSRCGSRIPSTIVLGEHLCTKCGGQYP